MDPITAIQLASSILAFVQIGATVLKTAKEIRDSKDGLSDDTRNRQVIAESMKGAIRKLRTADHDAIACDPSLLEVVAECEDLSGKIEDCLQKIQNSRLGRFGSASKALFKKDELEGLERKLDRCRSQLELALGNLRDERLVGYFKELESLLQNDRTKFEQLDADVKQLVDGVRLGHIGGEAKVQLEGILGIHDDALCAVYQDRILKSLRFGGMGRRYESIVDSHHKTFRWIFEDDDESDANQDDQSDTNQGGQSDANQDGQSANDTDEGYQSSNGSEKDNQLSNHTDKNDKSLPNTAEDAQPPHNDTASAKKFEMERAKIKRLEMKREASEKFSAWLSSPTGIFHVSGKLGSGKSTLLKYLYTSEHTRAGAKKWAGTRKLVFANFCFWKPGFEMQKSLDGLFRSLLHDILKACPELTREVLHEYWAEAEQTSWQIQTEFDIPPQAVQKSLENIIVGDRVNQDRCFCVFLDGLDEFDDSPRHHHDRTFLVDLLNRWSKYSGGNLMLCVSSREDNVFMDAFQETQRLRLHTLTLFDMQNYTRHALERFPCQKTKDRLIGIIPHKAEGIFLWAILVVKNIREMIPDGGVTDHELDEILNDLPSGLEELLQRIVQGLGKRDRKKAYQTLALLKAGSSNELPLSLLAFSFLDRYQKDPEFAVQHDFPTHVTDSNGRDDDDAPARYQKQLRRVCGGLVEHRQSDKWDEPWGCVEYTHRSVLELFAEGELKKDMESTLGGFNNVIALAHLVLAQVRFLDDDEVAKTVNMLYSGVVHMLLRWDGEKEPYTIVEFIDSYVKGSRRHDPGPGDFVSIITSPNRMLHPGSTSYRGTTFPTYFSTLSLAVFHRFNEYAKWKITHDPNCLDGPFERALVANIILVVHDIRAWKWTQGQFFDTGVFTDDTRACFNVFIPWHVVDTGTPANLTIWERYLVSLFLLGSWPQLRNLRDRFGIVVERFLQHGAATEVRIVVRGVEVEVEEVSFYFKHAEVTMNPPEPYSREGEHQHNLSWLRRAMGCEGEVHMSLRDYIEVWNPPNQDRLLELLDERESSEKRLLEDVTDTEPRPEELEGEPESSEQEPPNEKEGMLETEPVPAPATGPAEFRQKAILGLVVLSVLCFAWVRYGARKV